MRHYIAVIHKEPESGYGVSFPDLPGIVAVADTIDRAIREAGEVLAFAAEDWKEQTGSEFPAPRSIDDLRADAKFLADSADGFAVVIPFEPECLPHAAE